MEKRALIGLLMIVGVSMPTHAQQRGTTPAATSATRDEAGSVSAERRVQRYPADRAARLEAARAYLAEADQSPSKRAAAEEHVRAALEVKGDDPAALSLLGQIELTKGNAAAAALHFRSAIRFAPDDAAAHLGLGDALTRLGDEAGATAAFAEYRRIKGLPPLPAEAASPSIAR